MNRIEFMTHLEILLQDISVQEREDALSYYKDYFDEAGPEKEEEVIEALGDPGKVAENIKRNLSAGDKEEDITYESAYTPNGREITKYEGEVKQEKKKEPLSGGMIALIVILAILAAPIWFPIAISLLAVVFSLLVVWFSIILTVGCVAAAFIIVLFVLFGVGIACIGASPAASAVLIGTALVFGGLGLLFVLLVYVLVKVVTPLIIKGFKALGRLCTGKRNA